MDDSRHNDPTTSYTATGSSSTVNRNDLFSDTEKKHLHSFLDTFKSDEAYSTYSAEGRNNHMTVKSSSSSSPSPTPVLLSPPYSRNNTFEQNQIQTLPVMDMQQQLSNRKRTNEAKGDTRDMNSSNIMDVKKYRLMMDDNIARSSTPSSTSSSSSRSDHPSLATTVYINSNDMDRSFADHTYASSPSSSSPPQPQTSLPPQPGSSTSSSSRAGGTPHSGSSSGNHLIPTNTSKSKGSGRGRKPAHELLSEEQKKLNHIASEQKRRANIRIGFDQLVDIVPTLSECQRSESLILQKSADYIRQLVETKNGLRDRVRELQTVLGEVPDEDSSEGEMDYSF